jgi:hypothetical protein
MNGCSLNKHVPSESSGRGVACADTGILQCGSSDPCKAQPSDVGRGGKKRKVREIFQRQQATEADVISGSVQPLIRSTSEGIGGLKTHWKKGIASQLAPPVSSSAPSLPQSRLSTNVQPIERPAQLPVAKHATRNFKTPVQPLVNHELEDSEIGTGPDGGEIGLDKDDDLLDAVGRDKEVQGSLNKSHRNGTKTVRTFHPLRRCSS